ncbi:Uncharacterized protein APZ42_000135 [Daphnia magna]|uniref:Uncharacterized protein n=1 Tax=Daphnia magna TaxID=35525 RepID=A0A164JW60_9CRUS|nr:Uncharacterized protein APZ42_000135 [Daphnia magna]
MKSIRQGRSLEIVRMAECYEMSKSVHVIVKLTARMRGRILCKNIIPYLDLIGPALDLPCPLEPA